MMYTSAAASRVLLAGAMLALQASAAQAIVYTVDRTVGSGSVVGTITTDGTLGGLGSSNVVDWDLTLTAQSGSGPVELTITPANSALHVFTTPFTPEFSASESALSFNFADGLVAWTHPTGEDVYWCLDGVSSVFFSECPPDGSETVFVPPIYSADPIAIGDRIPRLRPSAMRQPL